MYPNLFPLQLTVTPTLAQVCIPTHDSQRFYSSNDLWALGQGTSSSGGSGTAAPSPSDGRCIPLLGAAPELVAGGCSNSQGLGQNLDAFCACQPIIVKLFPNLPAEASIGPSQRSRRPRRQRGCVRAGPQRAALQQARQCRQQRRQCRRCTGSAGGGCQPR